MIMDCNRRRLASRGVRWTVVGTLSHPPVNYRVALFVRVPGRFGSSSHHLLAPFMRTLMLRNSSGISAEVILRYDSQAILATAPLGGRQLARSRESTVLGGPTR